MRFRDSYHPFALITILFWSLAYVLTRLALQYFSVYALGFLRYVAASVALVILLLAFHEPVPKGRALFWILPSGVFGFFLYMIAFNQGCVSVSAATSSVVIATVPVMTALLARVIHRERMSTIRWVAMTVEFSGVVVLTVLKGGLSLNRGILWLLLAAVSLSLYNLLQRKLTRTYSGLQSSAYSIFIGTALLSVFLPRSIREGISAPLLPLLWVALLGVLSSAVAYATWAEAMKKAKRAASVSNYMFLTPFLTALLGYLLAGETPDRATLIGGSVILLGMLLFSFGDELQSRRTLAKNK